MVNVTFIGTVGSALTADQTYSSILIDENLLLDCGEGTTQKLIKLNMINKIETICITHLHNDHIMGIFSLLWYYWIASQRTRPLKITGPPKLEYTIKKILELINTPKDAFKFEIQMEELEDIEEIQILNGNEYKISAVKAEHNPISFAYRIEKMENGSSLVYTGDTRPVNRLIELARDCDLLICESTFPDEMADYAHKYGHCTPSDASELALKAGVPHLILTHISAIFQNKKEIEKFKMQAENSFKNKVKIARDLMKIII